MPTAPIRDNAVWFKHIEGDPHFVRYLESLESEAVLELEVDGVVGTWQRMRDGRDGRRTKGIRPVSTMKRIWDRWYETRRGEIVPIRPTTTAESYLSGLEETLSEWQSREDDEAFRGL